jgi:hypothetical protein
MKTPAFIRLPIDLIKRFFAASWQVVKEQFPLVLISLCLGAAFWYWGELTCAKYMAAAASGSKDQIDLWNNTVTFFGVVSMLVTIYFGVIGIVSSINSMREANSLKRSVRNLEEVVRFRLEHLPALMGPAVYIMEKAIGDIFFMTFTPRLGSAHLIPLEGASGTGVSVLDETNTIEFPEAVRRFGKALEDQIKNGRKVDLLVVARNHPPPQKSSSEMEPKKTSKTDRWMLFFQDLQKRGGGYKKLIVGDEVSKLETSFSLLNAAEQDFLTHAQADTPGTSSSPLTIRETSSIPFQMITAALPPRPDGTPRRGCLIFMVGNQTAGLRDAAMGFYTEIDGFVDMFLNVGRGLFDEGKATKAASLMVRPEQEPAAIPSA